MDDLKPYGKDKSQIHSIYHIFYIFIADIRIEFGVKYFGVLMFKGDKIKVLDGLTITALGVLI